jgi:FtsH-binding integral membrane protein
MCSVGAAVIFACLTGCALLEKRRSYLILYSAMSSAILSLVLVHLANVFARSTAIYTVELYMGLLLFCGFVLVDTQEIIEKATLGDRDVVKHSLDLFLDFAQLFARLLVVLIKNSGKKNGRNRRQQRS